MFIGPIIEKDPNIQKLRQEVANRMWDVIKDEEPVDVKNEIAFVSFEEALRELAAAKKS